jgi:hypothetical protein
MGACTSAILAEVYIQYMEHKQLYSIKKHQIIKYFRYLDFLIIYNRNITNIVETLTEFNKKQPV